MHQLRIVYRSSPVISTGKKKRPVKCERWRSISRNSPRSLSLKMEQLAMEQPNAAAFIEELVDRALNRTSSTEVG